MGNSSNRDQWAVQERLLFIERLSWWRGIVNRGDIRGVFGISAAQASADLRAYQAMNPGALAYNVSLKRYESREEMTCMLHVPRLEDAVGWFLGGGQPAMAATTGSTHPNVDVFSPPLRKADETVERRLFLAVDQSRKQTIHYWSVSSSRSSKREIAPHAFAHDGFRWHLRAWCLEKAGYRDFVLSRIESAGWPGDPFLPPVADKAWDTEVTLVIKPHSLLTDAQRISIERDYGMKSGKLELKVREAMRDYYLANLRIPLPDSRGNPRPRLLELG